MKIFNPYRALLKRKVRLKSIGYNLAGSFYSQLWYYFPILLVICLFPGSGAAQFEIELFGKISHGNTYVDQYGFPENLTSFLKGGNSTRSMLSSEELSMECVCLLNPLFMDTVPPAIICPADITIGCTANTLPANTGSATATDTCDSAPLVVFNDVTVASPSCENEYIINRTWTATDACANTANCIQIITIEDNEAPVILCPSDISVDPDPASTPNPTPGPATYFTINNGNWNSATTWVNGNIPNADNLANETIFIRHTVNYNISSAFKNNGVLRIEPFIGTTANLIVPTAINFENLSGGRIYIQSGAYTQYRFIGGGDSGIPQSGTFKNIDGIVRIRNSRVEVAQGFTSENTGSRLFENSCLLTGQNFSISGTGTIDSLIGASISIAWHGSGNFELSSGTILFQQTRVQIAGTSGSFLLSSGFANGDIDYITLRNHITDVTGSGKIEASSSLNVTGGLNLDAYCANEYISNGKFSGSQTPNCSLTDSYFPAMCAPTFPQDGCEAIVEYVVNATDNCSTPSVTQISGLPSGSSFPKGVTINTFVANDGCQTDTCSFTITVTDEPPAIVCPPNITLQCTSNTLPPATGTATASDNCDTIISITFSDNIINGSCPNKYTIARTWTATDQGENTTTCIQLITIDDSTPPVIACPPNITIQCTASTDPVNTGTATATDNCDPLVTPFVLSAIIVNGSCPQQRTITRSWRAIDVCGNVSNCVQVITVIDNVAPMISCPPNLTIECTTSTDPAITGSATGIDNCDTSVTISFTNAIITGSCPQQRTIYRTWRATDDCFNSATCIQVISIQDTISPVITCPADITILYPASTLPENTGSASAIDNCDPPDVSWSDTAPAENCPYNNIIIRTWVATDDCGNSNSCQQSILIEDHGEICGTVEDDMGQPLGDVEIRLIRDINENGINDAGDTIVSSVMSAEATGNYCFTDIEPCNYILVEIQLPAYGDLFDYDFTSDPDGNDSLDGPDNEITVILSQGELDYDNNFVDVVCALVLPVIPPDTICEGDSVILLASPSNPGNVTYTWNFGSGATPATGMGLGPHTVSYVTTTNNQMGGAIVSMTISKSGCPDLTGQVSTIDVNPVPNATISGSTSPLCYYTNRTFQPVDTVIAGATYSWTFGADAVPLTASGYGPHTVYYTTEGSKSVELTIHPNEEGAQCPDSSSIAFNVNSCPSNITGFVRSVSGTGISGVRLLLYADNNIDGIADDTIIIRDVLSTSTGSYSMVAMTPGSYVIIQEQPPTWASFDDLDVTSDLDYVANIDSLDNLIPSTIGPSEIDGGNNFIEIGLPGDISGAVFVDMNSNNFPETGEGIPGVIISLYSDNNKDGNADSGVPVDTAVTSASGDYIFNDISVGHYVLVKTQPSGYEMLQDLDSSDDTDTVPNTNMNNNIIPVTVENEELDEHNYFIDGFECTLTVVNTNDTGQGSLRYMIDCASDGATITFDPSLAGMNIFITSERIIINKNVILESTVFPRLTISSQIAGLFDIAAGKSIELRSLDIIGGTSGNVGSAFNNFGQLILNNIYVFKNPLLSQSEYLIRNNPGSELILIGNSFLMSE